MPTGPIEFLSYRANQRIPATEYGGADGLIQPAAHTMTPSEATRVLARAAMYGDDGVDPATPGSACRTT
jgi:hypothetical protein